MIALEELLCAFRQAFANLLGQTIMQLAGVNAGHVGYDYRSRRSDGNDQPDHAKEQKTGQSNQLQHQSMAGRVMAHGAKGHQKHNGGDAGHDHQAQINGAMQELAATAMGALGKVLLIVTAHLRREAGNVVTPAGENISYYFVSTHHADRREALRRPATVHLLTPGRRAAMAGPGEPESRRRMQTDCPAD